MNKNKQKNRKKGNASYRDADAADLRTMYLVYLCSEYTSAVVAAAILVTNKTACPATSTALSWRGVNPLAQLRQNTHRLRPFIGADFRRAML